MLEKQYPSLFLSGKFLKVPSFGHDADLGYLLDCYLRIAGLVI
jgi:hypothetical protein